MRKLSLFWIAIVLAAAVSLPACTNRHADYVRIHIRANSDSAYDQQKKLEARDSLVAYLAPLLEDCKNVSQAKKIIQNNLKEIEEIVNAVLTDAPYSCKTSLRKEYFPQKDYGELQLKAGKYDAIIVELGAGEGANWWCVAFPPLCFISDDSEGTVYKSKIMEIIQKNKEK